MLFGFLILICCKYVICFVHQWHHGTSWCPISHFGNSTKTFSHLFGSTTWIWCLSILSCRVVCKVIVLVNTMAIFWQLFLWQFQYHQLMGTLQRLIEISQDLCSCFLIASIAHVYFGVYTLWNLVLSKEKCTVCFKHALCM